jgi:hypothetical protein
MLVGELKKILSRYEDHQYVQVLMEKEDRVRYQMIIQDVIDSPGWHTDPAKPEQNIIRILIHEMNRIISTNTVTAEDVETERLIQQNLPSMKRKLAEFRRYIKTGEYP